MCVAAVKRFYHFNGMNARKRENFVAQTVLRHEMNFAFMKNSRPPEEKELTFPFRRGILQQN